MRKRYVFAFALLLVFVFMLSGCGNATTSTDNSEAQTKTEMLSDSNIVSEKTDEDNGHTEDITDESNILIAYFSRAGENYNVGVVEKGNTAIVAKLIAEETGGDLFQIQTVNPYPESYDECTDVAKQEQENNARPELKSSVENWDAYDTVFLGYPIWWGDMPMAVYTFMESYDWSGKTVIPFNTHEGSGSSGTAENIAESCNGATILDGVAINGETAQTDSTVTQQTVTEWLKGLNIAQ